MLAGMSSNFCENLPFLWRDCVFEELTVASVEITAKKFSFISTIGPTFLSENALRSEIRNFYF